MFQGIQMADTVKITYVEADGTKKVVDAEIGKNLLDVAHDSNIELEGMEMIVWGVVVFR